MKLSTTEQLTLNFLTNEYGALREAMPYNIVQAHILESQTLYNYQAEEYYKNQSSFNYNRLIDAMVRLQYWNQKKVTQDSLISKAMGE